MTKAAATGRSEHLAARLEPFDSYWQAPKDVEKGFTLVHGLLPCQLPAAICRPTSRRGSLSSAAARATWSKMLRDCGYTWVLGIDSDAAKVEWHGATSCPAKWRVRSSSLRRRRAEYDVIIPEQELNHLTLDETIEFLELVPAGVAPGRAGGCVCHERRQSDGGLRKPVA